MAPRFKYIMSQMDGQRGCAFKTESLSKDPALGGLPTISSDLLPDNLDQHPLPPPSVKLPVKDPLPGAKVKPATGHRD